MTSTLPAFTTATLTPGPGRLVYVQPVEFTTDAEIDRFYEWVQANQVIIAQVIPDSEHLVCAVSTAAGGHCGARATHAVLEWLPAEDSFDQAISCPAHLKAVIGHVVHGPDTQAPRPVWN
jgi:hypothetical protein